LVHVRFVAMEPPLPETPGRVRRAPMRMDVCESLRGRVANEVTELGVALADPASPLCRELETRLAEPLTVRGLQDLVEAATAAARAGGRWSLARAMAPEQELTEGTLRIVVVPVWLESVRIAGFRWSNPWALRRPFADQVGEPVNLKLTERALALLNQHPYRRVGLSLSPGERAGTTRLGLAVTERKPWTVFTGHETTHSRGMGTGRHNAGFTMAAPWRREDVWTAQYATDSGFGGLRSASTVYRHSLPGGRALAATGVYSRSETTGLFGQVSTDWMARLAWSAPLPRARGWNHEIELGAEWRRSDSAHSFAGFVYNRNAAAAAPLSAGWRGQRPDRRGQWSVSFDATAGLGWPLPSLDRAAYEAKREGAGPRWLALRGSVSRDADLPGGFRAQGRVWGQWSPDRLLDAGQFSLGGMRSVRGYREGEVSGDSGLGLSAELLSPPLPRWPPPSAAADPAETGRQETDPWRKARPLGLRAAAFADAGRVYRTAPRPPYENRQTSLAGAGLGLRLEYRPQAVVRADYGWRLRDTGVPADDQAGGYGYLSVQLAF